LFFEESWGRKAFDISAAWTHPDYRRKGIYNSLFQTLVAIGKKEKASQIIGGFHRNNTVSAAMQKNQKRIFRDYGGSFVTTILQLD
jgi:ribosomal protein S18 acetylase RimI-like enzyme